MHTTAPITLLRDGLTQFERNRYFYGKLLDEYHFRLETDYHNQKRWLINRAVLGYGVVCGLDVKSAPDQPNAIIVKPGFAIDKWGREIIVPAATAPIPIPPEVIAQAREWGEKNEPPPYWQEKQHDEEDVICVQVMICYHECETDPVPTLAGDCHSTEACAPGTIREGYRLKFTAHCERPHNDECQFPYIVADGRINYDALVHWVTRERDCLSLPPDPCIRLAHVRLTTGGHHCEPEHIDVSVRPIVYSNDLLFDILLGWQNPTPGRRQK
jgi:hypothetical protein